MAFQTNFNMTQNANKFNHNTVHKLNHFERLVLRFVYKFAFLLGIFGG